MQENCCCIMEHVASLHCSENFWSLAWSRRIGLGVWKVGVKNLRMELL